MQRVWVIRKTAYRESSLLLTLLADDHQIVRAVGRGAGKGSSRLDLFQPFFVELKGAPGSLCRVQKHEAAGARIPLQAQWLIGGLYLNEISQCLVPEGLQLEGLFDAYTDALVGLASGKAAPIRSYERLILEHAGYYPILDRDHEGRPLHGAETYRLHNGQQLVAVEASAPDGLLGSDWIALSDSRYDDAVTLRHAKWLHRSLVDQASGGRRLFSRELLQTQGLQE